jgi:hypothetical protein
MSEVWLDSGDSGVDGLRVQVEAAKGSAEKCSREPRVPRIRAFGHAFPIEPASRDKSRSPLVQDMLPGGAS